MKRIGILTYHAGLNHGGFLQVYCLSKYLESFGHRVSVINYINPIQQKDEWRYFISSNRICTPKGFFKITRNLLKFARFQIARKQLNLTIRLKSTEMEKISAGFDIVVTGSDEIWNVNSFAFPKDVWYFFGEKLGAKKLISFSPSFGNTNEKDLNKPRVKGLLQQYDHITVRDQHSQDLIKLLLNKDVPVTLDPTFLFDPYQTIKTCRPFKQGYILLYVNSITELEKEKLIDFSRRRNLPIISISYPYFWANKNDVAVGITKWLSYFKYAEFVVTNTYHGLIFAAKNTKPTWILSTPTKSNKIIGLLSQLNISHGKVILSENLDLEEIFDNSEAEFRNSQVHLRTLINENKILFSEIFN